MSIDIATIPADFFAPSTTEWPAPSAPATPPPASDDDPLASFDVTEFRTYLQALAPETVVGISNCAAICPLAHWLSDKFGGVAVHVWKRGYATPTAARVVLDAWWAAFVEAVDFPDGPETPGQPLALFVEKLAHEVTAAEALAILDRIVAA